MRVNDLEFTGDPNQANWAKNAACLSADPEAMFIEGKEQNDVIKNICRNALEECPVQAACVVEGIKANAKGVWGGVNEHWRNIYGRQVLRIVAAEGTIKKDEQIHRNTYPEEYARLSHNATQLPLDSVV